MISKIYKLFAAGVVCCGLTTVLTACEDKEYTLDMPENQLLTSVELYVDKELPLLVGTDSAITYKVLPDDAAFKDLMWKSSNEMVATVSADGVISALSLGKTVITACPALGFGTENTQKSIAVTVIDKVIPIQEIRFTNQETTLYVDDNMQLTYELLPANHTYSHLLWRSSDESVASVDQNGVVKGLKSGQVTIKAYATDKSGTVASIDLTVIKSVPAEDISLAPQGPLYWKQTLNLDYTLQPVGANSATIEWESSDPAVLTVNRGVVTAVGFGTATVTATCPNGKKSEVTLTVFPGFYVWDASTEFEGWTINNNLGSIERRDGVLKCTVTTDSNHRIYLQRVYSTAKNLMDLNFQDYPVIALKTSAIPSGATFQCNLANLEKTLSVSPAMSKVELADGTMVWYYDFGNYANLTNADGVVPIRAFIFKILKVGVPTFDVEWIRTFKSVDEMNNFIGQ